MREGVDGAEVEVELVVTVAVSVMVVKSRRRCFTREDDKVIMKMVSEKYLKRRARDECFGGVRRPKSSSRSSQTININFKSCLCL